MLLWTHLFLEELKRPDTSRVPFQEKPQIDHSALTQHSQKTIPADSRKTKYLTVRRGERKEKGTTLIEHTSVSHPNQKVTMANFIYTSYEGARGPVAAFPQSLPATIVRDGYEITILNTKICWRIHVQYSCGHPVLEERQEASASAVAPAAPTALPIPTVEQMVNDNSIQYTFDDFLAAIEREGNTDANASANANVIGNQQQQPPPLPQQLPWKPVIIEFKAHRRADCTYKCAVEQMAHRLQAKCKDCAYWGPNGQWRRDYDGPMFREFLNSVGQSGAN